MIHNGIHVHEFFDRTFLGNPKLWVFFGFIYKFVVLHGFIYEFMVLHGFIYEFMPVVFHGFIHEFLVFYMSSSMKSLPVHFLVPQNLWSYMISCLISWIWALFHGRDHIGNYVWKRLWRIPWNIYWLHGSFTRIFHWIHGSCEWQRCIGHPVAAAPESRATCLTVSLSVWQSYSITTCHLGLISHPHLAASAASTWISQWS